MTGSPNQPSHSGQRVSQSQESTISLPPVQGAMGPPSQQPALGMQSAPNPAMMSLGGLPPELVRAAFAQASMVSPNQLLALARSLPGLQVGLQGVNNGSQTSALELLQSFQNLSQNQQQQQQQQLQQQVYPNNNNTQQGNSNMDQWKAASNEKAVADSKVKASAGSKEPGAATTISSNSSSKSGGSSKDGVILPCRARGMPIDHNFRTAHFRIPEDVRHGEDLICSYLACRNGGIKFRYCAACRAPVAKRNFHQRHSHGIPSAEDENANKLPANPEGNKEAKKEAKPEASKKKPSGSVVEITNSRIVKESDNKGRASLAGNELFIARKGNESDNLSDEDISVARRMRWSTLLGKRPDTSDTDGMSAWLLEVMAVSDLKNSLKNSGTSSLTGSSSEFSTEASLYQSSSSVTSMSSDSDNSDDYAARKNKRRTHRRKKRRREVSNKKRKSSSDLRNRDKKRRKPDDEKAKNPEEAPTRESNQGLGESGLSGSYAEWRDRKKKKAQLLKQQQGQG